MLSLIFLASISTISGTLLFLLIWLLHQIKITLWIATNKQILFWESFAVTSIFNWVFHEKGFLDLHIFLCRVLYRYTMCLSEYSCTCLVNIATWLYSSHPKCWFDIPLVVAKIIFIWFYTFWVYWIDRMLSLGLNMFWSGAWTKRYILYIL